jgi:ABC-2 type transport system ATP-binding protein
VTGEGLAQLAQDLRGKPGVAMVAAFGTALHVSGTDAHALEQTVASLRARPGLAWRRSEPGLEDVFIRMMDQAPGHRES